MNANENIEPTAFYTVTQAASFLGVERTTIRRWCSRTDSSKLPYQVNVMNGRKAIQGRHLIRLKHNLSPISQADLPTAVLQSAKEPQRQSPKAGTAKSILQAWRAKKYAYSQGVGI